MATRFLLTTDSASTPTRVKNGITAYLKAQDRKFWHWFDDVWLIAELPSDYTAEKLSLELREFVEGLLLSSFIVFEVSGTVPYHGRATKPAWEWMYSSWGLPDGAQPDEKAASNP